MFTVHRVDAQPNSQNRSHDREINSKGDTLVVIYHDGAGLNSTARRLQIDQEIAIDSDGDTTIVANVRRIPTMKGRRHHHRYRRYGGGSGKYDQHKPMHRRHQRNHSFSLEDVEINSEGDTLMIIHYGDAGLDMPTRRVRIQREISIDSDGDTTIVTNLMRSPRMKGRQHHQRHGHHRFMHQRQHIVYHESDDAIKLQQMEKEALALARELRRADEGSHPEKEEALRVQLQKIFDFKHEMKSKRLAQRQQKLEMRSQSVEERLENQEIIIEDRMNQLLGRGSSYRW